MVHVVVFTKNGLPTGFRAGGHSGYAPSGEDIVCSAVSALTQTALLGILQTVEAEAEYSIGKSGSIQCSLKEQDEEKQRNAQLIIRVMYEGLCSIEKEYNKYLRVSEREVT